MPTIKLNVQADMVCDVDGRNGFYLADIIGQADNVAGVDDCLAGCMNIKECVAINYVSNLKQCVALKSGTTDGSNLLFAPDVYQTFHYLFKNCPSSKASKNFA